MCMLDLKKYLKVEEKQAYKFNKLGYPNTQKIFCLKLEKVHHAMNALSIYCFVINHMHGVFFSCVIYLKCAHDQLTSSWYHRRRLSKDFNELDFYESKN